MWKFPLNEENNPYKLHPISNQTSTFGLRKEWSFTFNRMIKEY